MVDVTPPPMARIPKDIQPDLNKYLVTLNRILLQLWTRTGGAEDLIDFSAEGEDNNNQINYLVGQINALREQLECIQCNSMVTDLNPLMERLTALESDITPIYIPEPVEASSSTSKAYAHHYLSGAGATGLGSTEVTLTVNATGETSGDTSLSSNQVTINKTGIFEVNANVYLNNSSTARVEYSMWIEQNGTEVVGSRFASYQRGYDSGMTSSIHTILDVTSGDTIQIQCQLTDGTTSSGYQDSDGTSIVIKEL